MDVRHRPSAGGDADARTALGLPTARATAPAGYPPPSGVSIAVDTLYQERRGLHQARQLASELEEEGIGMLGQLGRQNDMLQAMKDRLGGTLDTLVVSAGLMRSIERRERIDIIVMYSGICSLVVLVIVLWWFLR